MKPNIHKKMTFEEAANELKNYHREDGTVPEEITLAIQVLETGEVYMTGEDYNLYMEGYKSGLSDGRKDAEPKQGEWKIEETPQYSEIRCPFCQFSPNEVWLPNFCSNCGAKLKKGGAEE